MKKAAALPVFLVGVTLALSAFATDVDQPAPAVPIAAGSLTLKLYRFGLSTSPTCENMTIYAIEKPDFVDFTTNPELGTADVPKGTYPCIGLELDQVVSGTPAQTTGTCITGQPSSEDVCAGFENALPPDPSVPHEGSIFDGIQPLGGDASQIWMKCKPGGDHFALYLTTQVVSPTTGNPGRPPTSATDQAHGYPLGAALVVGDHTTGTLVVTASLQSYDNGCFVGSPTFAFESTN